MRRTGASFDQNHKLTGRAIGVLNPESPASYNSSVEVFTQYVFLLNLLAFATILKLCQVKA